MYEDWERKTAPDFMRNRKILLREGYGKMKGKFVQCIIAIMFLVYAMSNAIFGLMLGSIIDVILSKNIEKIIVNLLLTLLFLLINYFSGLLAWKLAYREGMNSLIDLKRNLFKSESQKNRNEDIDITLYTDKSTYLLDKYFLAKWEVIYNILIAIAAIVALLVINWGMCIVALIVSFAPMLVPRLLKKRLMSNSTNLAAEETEYSNLVRDYLLGRYEWTKYGNEVEKRVEQNANKKDIRYEKCRMKNEYGIYAAQASTNMVGNAGFVIVFAIGAIMSIYGIITAGSIVSVIQLLNYLVGPITRASGAKSRVTAAEEIYNGILERTNYISESNIFEPRHLDSDTEVSVKNLSISFENKKILENASFEIRKGKKYLVKGRSGAGKTSLARALSENMKEATGLVLINDDGEKKIRYVEQTPYIFKDTIWNNIVLFREKYSEDAKKLMKRFNLDSLDKNMVFENESALSGGEKYRISLIRALLDRPDMLIVDEPSAALDIDNAKIVYDYLLGLDATVVIISHDENREWLKSVDDIITIENKMIAFEH
jgi:ABC-type bacteriocin/lantibiotic exporter with double-glycine peptidase domain